MTGVISAVEQRVPALGETRLSRRNAAECQGMPPSLTPASHVLNPAFPI